jgi:membrane-bound lytic murein transglycosylase MltF
MIQRRNIRALVLINPIGFFYTDGQPMGAIYQGLTALQDSVNEKFKTGALKVSITFIPVRPDQLEAALSQGVGDFIAYGVIVTKQRQQSFAFTSPLETNIKQVVVSGPSFGSPSNLEELGGRQIYVNPLSVAYQKLQAVNEGLRKAGKPEIIIKSAAEYLQDDDLVQMVNAGIIPATIADDSRAKLWSQVLPHLVVHPELIIGSGQQTAWVVRKSSPELKQLLDQFLATHGVGNSFGNTLVRRYLENTTWVKDATSTAEMRKFAALSALFKEYAGQYGFDYLMIMAQGYQESTLDQSLRGRSGAVGIMQVLPQDAAASPINVRDVTETRNNILAGVKMLRQIEDQYFADPKIEPLDKMFMALASYNAGPNRIASLRKQAELQGLDPNQWFGNVELVVAKEIGQETVNYVGNVYKYYVGYKLALAESGH